jgi:hypothetical protein
LERDIYEYQTGLLLLAACKLANTYLFSDFSTAAPMAQLTDTLVMVAPTDFAFNVQTAPNNEFQHQPSEAPEALRHAVRQEFDAAVALLQEAGVTVLVLEKPPGLPQLPDAVFPNNWFATLADGTVFICKMASANRQAEALQWPALQALLTKHGRQPKSLIYLDGPDAPVLEGTGSLILDRTAKVAYAALSERTTAEALSAWQKHSGYPTAISFKSRSRAGKPFYHTNVLMAIAEKFAVICLEALPDAKERTRVSKALSANHEVIELSLAQTEENFCANILQVSGGQGPLTVMSQTAYSGFTPAQIARIEHYGPILALNIPTIERVGGGSARCMLAEVFLPKV